jgi:hypothetical protein
LYDGRLFQSGNYHIYDGTHLCANATILATLDVFWFSFAFLQLGGHFDVGGTSKAVPIVSSICTPSLSMLLQSLKLVLLFINDEVFFTFLACLLVIELCLSTHTKHEGM